MKQAGLIGSAALALALLAAPASAQMQEHVVTQTTTTTVHHEGPDRDDVHTIRHDDGPRWNHHRNCRTTWHHGHRVTRCWH